MEGMSDSPGCSPGPQGTGDGSHGSSSPFRPGAGAGVSSGSRITWGSNIPPLCECVCIGAAVQPTGMSVPLGSGVVFAIGWKIVTSSRFLASFLLLLFQGKNHNSISENGVVVSFVVT